MSIGGAPPPRNTGFRFEKKSGKNENIASTDILELLPPWVFTPPCGWTIWNKGGKNSRITAGGGKFLRLFAVKSFRNTLFLVVKTQKHTQKVLKFSPPAVERRKNTLLLFEYTPNRVKYCISAPRRRRNFLSFYPPPCGWTICNKGG